MAGIEPAVTGSCASAHGATRVPPFSTRPVPPAAPAAPHRRSAPIARCPPGDAGKLALPSRKPVLSARTAAVPHSAFLNADASTRSGHAVVGRRRPGRPPSPGSPRASES